MAAECGVSRRTVFRDLDLLRIAGIPLHFDDDERAYRIESDNFLPPTQFTPEEALALIVLCNELGDRAGLPFFDPAGKAALKLETCLPKELRALVRERSASVQIKLEPKNALASSDEFFRILVSAAADRLAVRIEYDDFSSNRSIGSKLYPYRIFFSRRSWYVIGRSSLHRAVRTFNVGRLRNVELLDETYRVPRGFSLDRYMRNAWHMIPEPGPDHEVLIRFQPKVAGNVAEVRWHKTQQIQFNEDGTLDFQAKVSGLNEISWWVLGYGDQAEVIRPVALRDILREHFENLLARYSEKSHAGLGDGPSRQTIQRWRDSHPDVLR